MSELPKFLTEHEAAKVLKLKVRRLQYWRMTKAGPRYYKFGQSVRYTPPDLIEWAQAQARQPAGAE